MPVTSYSRTAADNNGAPPNGAPEGWAPSAVNNVVRQIMKDIVDEAAKGEARVLASVAGTDTITASMTPDLDAYTTGMIVVFTPANNSTGPVTINIDSLGAKDLTKFDATALASGDLQASTIHVAVYDGTRFVLLNPNTSAYYGATTSNFTGTLQYGGIEVGYRGYRQSRDVTNTDSTAATDAAGVVRFTGGNTFTFTADSDPASLALVTLINAKSGGTLTISGSVSLDWFNGSGTISSGNRTLAIGGWATLYHVGAGAWYILGTGLS
jgi:hypothetical protein